MTLNFTEKEAFTDETKTKSDDPDSGRTDARSDVVHLYTVRLGEGARGVTGHTGDTKIT